VYIQIEGLTKAFHEDPQELQNVHRRIIARLDAGEDGCLTHLLTRKPSPGAFFTPFGTPTAAVNGLSLTAGCR
jgi:hypothetical protein